MRNQRFFMYWWCLYVLLGVLFGHSQVVGKDTTVPVWEPAVSNLATTNTSTMTLHVLQVYPMRGLFTNCTTIYRYLI